MNDIQKNERLGMIKYNNRGYLMKCVEYNSYNDIVVEFQDKYKFRTKSNWGNFIKGEIKNPYSPTVYGVGIIGEKNIKINKKHIKEYVVWHDMLKRCYNKSYKEENPIYQNAVCCVDWLLFDNFYEWIHKQENFEKWLNGYRWAIDKDILYKGNKIYSPDTCCLVPNNVNTLFIKNNTNNNLPVGVYYCKDRNKYSATCNDYYGKAKFLGRYSTSYDAFYFGYKPYKEKVIKQIAQSEFENGNITKRCYDAMMNYQVEITD